MERVGLELENERYIGGLKLVMGKVEDTRKLAVMRAILKVEVWMFKFGGPSLGPKDPRCMEW